MEDMLKDVEEMDMVKEWEEMLNYEVVLLVECEVFVRDEVEL